MKTEKEIQDKIKEMKVAKSIFDDVYTDKKIPHNVRKQFIYILEWVLDN